MHHLCVGPRLLPLACRCNLAARARRGAEERERKRASEHGGPWALSGEQGEEGSRCVCDK